MERGFKGVVKLYCEGASPTFAMPWQVGEQEAWTGSGFVVRFRDEGLIITNAHVVEHAFAVRISRQEDAGKKLGQILCVAHDLDLALVRVPGWSDAGNYALKLAEALPELFGVVHALGFPEGGTTVCVTKGVVSRVDAQIYAHAQAKGFGSLCAGTPGKLLILQIDAAINAGNSGGPALGEDGRVLGVSSSALDNAQNIGYVIPTLLVQLFLNEYASSGSWTGVCELGFSWRTLENKTMRERMGISTETGVLVTSVAPLGKLGHFLQESDVLLSIDGQTVSCEGTVCYRGTRTGIGVQLPLEYLITSKPRGTETTLGIVRSGQLLQITSCHGPVPPLLPRYEGADAYPSFAIFGGLVFTRLSMPLYQEMIGGEEGIGLSKTSTLISCAQRWKQHPDEDVVILLRVLRHPINEGIDVTCSDLRVVSDVNGKRVATLADLVTAALAVLHDDSPHLVFTFQVDERLGINGVTSTEVLPTLGLLEADGEILSQNGISAPVSEDLREIYAKEAPADNANVAIWLACLQALRKKCVSKKRVRTED
jgi:S1-C subfamily serine protease